MKALVQRVGQASVTIESRDYFQAIGKGLVILLGVTHSDTVEDVDYLVKKSANIRLFSDSEDKMNLSLQDVNGEVLIISQFTLYGDARKGNRPNFIQSAKPEKAQNLYNLFVGKMKNIFGPERVKEGIFGEMMKVKICNNGPVTLMIESEEKFNK